MVEGNVLIDAFETETTFLNECTGCFACFSVCRFKAIEMEADSEGFLYPKVNNQKCTQCKKCKLVCPVLRNKEITYPINIISASSQCKEMKLKSSSGGIVGEISNEVLGNNGIVFGAVFNPKLKIVEHSSSDKYKIEDLMRSKYVQSSINDTYLEALNNLKNDRIVVFVGTPCQVHGFKSFIKKDYKNLITIDFMCHGVPSPGLLSKVINNLEIQNKAEIINVTFREKDFGWREQCIKFYFSNGKIKKKKSRFFYFYQLFINNYSIRKSCYSCDYYHNHVSDITLADNWAESGDDQLGKSIIFINTKKGEQIILDIKDKINVYSDIENINFEYYKHGYSKRNRDTFFNEYSELDDLSLIKKYRYIGFRYQLRRMLQRLGISK